MKFLTQLLPLITIIILLVSQKEVLCSEKPTGISFNRKNEPNENAFSILVPKNWQITGGIFRVNPLQVGGPLNSIEAKCDLILQSDSKGTVSFHILPDIVYAHAGVGGGFFPIGGYYQGAEVRQMEDAITLIANGFSSLHPNATSISVIKTTKLPGEKQAIDTGLAYANQLLTQIGLQALSFQSDAAGAVYEYTEDGTKYREILLTGMVNMPAALTWKNTRSIVFRAPVENFDKWRPTLDIIRSSIVFNMEWFLKESKGQRERAEIVQKVYEECRRIDQEIMQKTTVNREEIMNDNYLVLTGQEEYTNPHTGKTEIDTDEYKYRWKTSEGDVYYTNREDENPNRFLNNSGYKRTKIQKRKN